MLPSENIQLTINFSNYSGTTFTLGNNNSGFPSPTLAQDMSVTQCVSSPLSPNQQQALIVAQNATIADDAGEDPGLIGAATNLIKASGDVSVSIIWTSYTPAIRFGISASIESNLGDKLETAGIGLLDAIPFLAVPPAAPTITWAYMLDSAPDQAVNWIQPNQVAAVTLPLPNLSGYQISIRPTVDQYSLLIDCELVRSS